MKIKEKMITAVENINKKKDRKKKIKHQEKGKQRRKL